MTTSAASSRMQHKTGMWFALWFMIISTLLFLTTASSAEAGRDNPPGRVARISYLKGTVSFLPTGHDQWSEATLNYVVTTGDRVYTDHGSRAELEVGPYTVRLSEQTDLSIIDLNDEHMQLGLNQGSLRVSVYQLPHDNAVEIDTPNGSLTVRKRGKYRADVDPNADRTLITVNSGRLEITGGDLSETLENSQAALLTGHNPNRVEFVDLPARDSFDHWSDERDLRLASSTSTQYVSRFMDGYADLDIYGHWIDVSGYGPVWYPVVPAGWVPYRFGHWVWIDPWGWTWIEDEAWGFCPFHYGRWVLIGGTWGWLPGPMLVAPIYAPAFVAFLGGPGFSLGIGTGVVAWFPLGPPDPYFPWYHYSGNYLQQVNVTNIRNVTNITNIANISNVSNINNIHYTYKNVATTAVPVTVFTNGQHVSPHVVRLTPEQLAKAQVIPHPSVNPSRPATAPGRPVPSPPVHSARLAAANKIALAASRPSPVRNRRSVPPNSSKGPRRSPPTRTEARAPTAIPRRPKSSRRPLIMRTPPPPPPVPFEERYHAMLEHPGRPLEPQQLQNLRAGRPPGPMLDSEFPPHVAPVPSEHLSPFRPATQPPRPPKPQRTHEGEPYL